MYKTVLLDYSMPEMDGPTVATHISELLERNNMLLEKPYICCCSAYQEANFKQVAIDAGMNEFVNKPVSSKHLKEILQKTN